MNIRPRDARQVEVHFGRLAPDDSAGRLVVQIADGEARLGMRSGEDGAFQPFAEFKPVRLQTSNSLAYKTLAIRRWSDGWGGEFLKEIR